MSDSFFTSRNFYDQQVANLSALNCGELVEAASRRIIELEGPFKAAERLQRLSDICAGAYVLPIEHWKLEAAPAALEDEPTDDVNRSLLGRLRQFLSNNPVVAFWAGVFVGLYIAGRT